MLIRSKILAGVAAVLLVFGVGLLVGYKVFVPKPKAEQKVNTQMILTALHDRGFLVTQTYVFDTPVTIERSSGNAFKDFFFGQTIEARGTMEVNMGIDLAKVKEEDVGIDPNAGTVTITLPGASLFNVRLVGPIELKNRQGILKKLIDSDDGYNDALALLSKTAEEAATKPELIERTDERARDDVRRLLEYVVRGEVVEVATSD